MRLHASLFLLFTAGRAAAAPEPRWELASRGDGIYVYARGRPGSNVREVKATGMIDAPPEKVWAVIRDYDSYTKRMPYTEVAKVISRQEGDKSLVFYSVVSAPLVSKRDFVIRILDESTWDGTKGFFKASWTTSDQGPPETKDIVRVKVNDGYWLLEPREEGKKTFATYWLYTDPGGSVPKWLVNRANSGAVPDVFKAVRRASAEK
jgi:hypothetical protein